MNAASPSRTLLVTLNRMPVGQVEMNRHGLLTFIYDDDYRRLDEATPLSVSMPLVVRTHSDRVIRPWMQNLLPDNGPVLDRWAAQFKVSANSPFALLRHVGRDVAGAAQFIPDDLVHDLSEGGIDWLSDDDLTQRLREVRADPSAWTPAMEAGLFSLAGAQAKIALRKDPEHGWGLPWGAEPTTHILKPYNDQIPHHALNEHLSLRLAYELGMPAAASKIESIDGSPVLIVERYDRYDDGGELVRVHQEDMCQASGRGPGDKYESDGGPSASSIATLLTRLRGPGEAAADVSRFIRSQAFMLGIAATDAHAKNYSLLLSGASVALSPLYDVQSAAPYFTGEVRDLAKGQVSVHRAQLAMRIGARRRFMEIGAEDWRTFARDCGRPDDEVLDIAAETLSRIVASVREVGENEESIRATTDEERDFIGRYISTVAKHADLMRNNLAGRGPSVGKRR